MFWECKLLCDSGLRKTREKRLYAAVSRRARFCVILAAQAAAFAGLQMPLRRAFCLLTKCKRNGFQMPSRDSDARRQPSPREAR